MANNRISMWAPPVGLSGLTYTSDGVIVNANAFISGTFSFTAETEAPTGFVTTINVKASGQTTSTNGYHRSWPFIECFP